MRLITILLLLPQLTFAQGFFERVNQFLINYVDEGKIDYQYLKDNSEQLERITLSIAEFYLGDQSEDYKAAFYINTYNILVIQQVVENYPIASPMDVDGFFNQTKHMVDNPEQADPFIPVFRK